MEGVSSWEHRIMGIIGRVSEFSSASGGLTGGGRFPVLVIAHRGASGSAPENTLASFRKAIDLGSDVIEADIRLSQDRQVVVIHDDALDRTVRRTGKVSELTLDRLKHLDAGSWFAPQFAGERIPTLKEVLELAKGRARLDIELKTDHLGRYTVQDLADAALGEVEKLGMEKQVIFCSFNLEAIESIQEKGCIATALVYGRPWISPEELIGSRSVPVLSCRKTSLNKKNVSRGHRKGIKVWTWSVDTQEEIQQSLDIGVDGIITNYPERAIEFLKNIENP